ncbi:hypothetical protein [Spiroplasma turonicum]|uniref:Uncharacterized protein n=1 Tax=Spiroplasma turonicum TaxID=216946 RepID=A0A0K1P6H0_9MOLU|nr:hypothetical protein [Spiroplasma turonicum]AKU79898.1 hypothetical protein STURON_00652 [Spiroplasma turonicum]ALX70909.1 hypothetical protein STURO_v1c06500 [Spiroplasma turonicum]
MKKLVLSLIALFNLNGFLILNPKYYVNKVGNFESIKNDINEISTRGDSYNPTFPTISKSNLNITANAHIFSTSGGDHGDVKESGWISIINMLDYARSVGEFLNNYSSISYQFDASYYHDAYGYSSWGWFRDKYNKNYNLKTLRDAGSGGIMYERDQVYKENYHSTNSRSKYKLRISGNSIQGYVEGHAWGYVKHTPGTNGIDVKDEPIIHSVTIYSSFNQSNIEKR